MKMILLFGIVIVVVTIPGYRHFFCALLFAAAEYQYIFVKCLFNDYVELSVAKICPEISHFVWRTLFENSIVTPSCVAISYTIYYRMKIT